MMWYEGVEGLGEGEGLGEDGAVGDGAGFGLEEEGGGDEADAVGPLL